MLWLLFRQLFEKFGQLFISTFGHTGTQLSLSFLEIFDLGWKMGNCERTKEGTNERVGEAAAYFSNEITYLCSL